MTGIHDVLRWANRTAVAEEITRRGYRVSGETLNRWYRQRAEVPAVVERIVFELFGTNENAAPPKWAERLAEETAARVIEALASPDRLAEALDVIAELDARVRQRSEAPPAKNDTEGPGAGSQRVLELE